MAHILRRENILVDQGSTALQSVGRVLQRLTNFLLDGVLIVLGLRFILRFFGANPLNEFVALLYGMTYPAIAPFSGMFGSVRSTGVAAFEVSTLIAMLVIGVLLHAIIRLIGILTQTPTYLDESER